MGTSLVKLWMLQAELTHMETFVGPPRSNGEISRTERKIQVRKERIAKILSERKKLDDFLDEQRDQLFAQGGAKKLSAQLESTKIGAMGQKPRRPFYYLQEAFSRPGDYVEAEKNDEKRLLPFLVIDPERVQKKFLAELGIPVRLGVDEGKEEAISILKGIFSKLFPLRIGERAVSARISVITDPCNPWDGKLLSFQNISWIATDEADRRYRTNRAVARVFADIFDAVRSQWHAQKELEAKIGETAEIRERIDHLVQGGKKTCDPAAEAEITKIREKLAPRTEFFARMALKSRLERITGRHPIQDSLRLIWAFNDLTKSLYSDMGKMRTITEQRQYVELEIATERSRFDELNRSFSHLFSEAARHWGNPRGEGGKMSPHPEARWPMRWAVETISRYLQTPENTVFHSEPFASVRSGILARKEVFPTLPSGSSDLQNLRFALSCQIFLKESELRIWAFESENAIKTSESKPATMNAVKNRAKELAAGFQNAEFLWKSPVAKRVSERFKKKAAILMRVAHSEKEEDVLKILESFKTPPA